MSASGAWRVSKMKKKIIAALLLVTCLVVGFLLLPGPKRVPYSQQTSAVPVPAAIPAAPSAPNNLTPMP